MSVKGIVCTLLLTAILLTVVGCGDDNLSDAFRDIQGNISREQGRGNSSSTATDSQAMFENPNNIDYSAYNTIVRSYRKALSSAYGELTTDYNGYFYANLIDLNADDVYELVVARVYNSDAQGDTSDLFYPGGNQFIGSQYNDYVHIYYLNGDGSVNHAGEYPLSFYGEEGMQFNIEYTEVDGRNYLAFGGDHLDFGITSADYVFAKSIMSFNGEYFELEEMFSIEYDYVNAGYEPTDYRQNMEQVSQQEFDAQFYDKWFENPTQHTFVAQGFETNTDEITQATIDFLGEFELKNTHSDAFTYDDGNFVLYERSYFNEEELVLKYILDAIANQDFASMLPYATEQIVEGYSASREQNSYYPGLIVEEMELIYPEYYGWDNVQVMQYILENEKFSDMYRQNGLENTFILKVDAKDIIDMEVVQFAGQFGLNVTQYYMFETDEDGNNPQLVSSFDNNFFWGEREVYEVLYVTDYEQIFNAYGYEYPSDIMEMYFTPEEIENMGSYITEDAKEAYFVRNLWGGTMKVYENYIDEYDNYARGELLYETSGDVLYLGCSSDNVVNDIIYTDVQIVAEPFSGYEVTYYPSISHPDSWANYGVYAQEMFPIA